MLFGRNSRFDLDVLREWLKMTESPTVSQPFLSFICTIQKMKPDWDKLMDAFADSDTQLIADVDCTTEGKDLCTAQGIKGYVSN